MQISPVSPSWSGSSLSSAKIMMLEFLKGFPMIEGIGAGESESFVLEIRSIVTMTL